MLLISHRGNINGPIPDKENSPEYVEKAISLGYYVEIDVWYHNNGWFLGHDEPQHKVDLDFLMNEKLWCHAKNIEALNLMLKYPNIHCFWHQEDDVTITSLGYIWTYPNIKLTNKSICVLPEKANYEKFNCFGICSDFIENYKMQHKIKTVLFDLDGVLVDACEWHFESFNRALHEIAGFSISRFEHEKTFNGLPTKTKMKILIDSGLLKKEDSEKVWKLKQEYTIDVVKESAVYDDGKIKLLKHLKENNIRVACVTNSIRETAELMLLLTGQLEHLEFVITNEDVNNPKPDPEGYIKAMKRLDTIPVETLIVEDSEKGFQAARKSGARVFLANSVSSVKIDQLEKILKIFSNTKDFSLGGEIIDKNSKVKQVWSKK